MAFFMPGKMLSPLRAFPAWSFRQTGEISFTPCLFFKGEEDLLGGSKRRQSSGLYLRLQCL